jgi:hypothetical protein
MSARPGAVHRRSSLPGRSAGRLAVSLGGRVDTPLHTHTQRRGDLGDWTVTLNTTTAHVDETVLLATSNRDLDEMFRASPPGDVPLGVLDGTTYLFPGSRLAKPLAALVRRLWWQGKVVDAGGTWLLNRVGPLSTHLIKADVYPADSWVDGRDCIVLDYSRTSFVARGVRDEIRLVAPRLYLGVVWLWRRRVAWFSLRVPGGR